MCNAFLISVHFPGYDGIVYGMKLITDSFNNYVMKKPHFLLLWSLRIIAASILLYAVYLNADGNTGYLQLFNILNTNPPGRMWTGIFELLAAFLILVPRATGYGAVLGICIMAGAIYFHLTRLGIFFGGNAKFFLAALTVFISCTVLIFFYRKEIELPPCVGMG